MLVTVNGELKYAIWKLEWKSMKEYFSPFRNASEQSMPKERSIEKIIHSSRRTPESRWNIPIHAINWKLLDSREGPDDPFKLYRRAEAVVAPNLTKGVLQTAWSSLKKSLLRFRQDRRIEAAPLYTTRDTTLNISVPSWVAASKKNIRESANGSHVVTDLWRSAHSDQKWWWSKQDH